MTNLQELLDRVKAATGPDRELDAGIAEATAQVPEGAIRMHGLPGTAKYATGGYTVWDTPAYTASIDAALALTERVLPGWVVADLCQNSRHAGDPWGCTLAIYYGSTPSKNKAASSGYDFSTASLAILAATLSALIAKDAGE